MKICCTIIALFPVICLAGTLTPVWVEVGPKGQAVARVVVSSTQDCPAIAIDDGTPVPMKPRLPVPKGFQPVCEFLIPAAAKSAAAGSQQLALPVPDPSRIVVIGDTGCRLKGERLQACNDPEAWPFARISEAAANTQPQLVVHVGDYVYRETPCPATERAACGGSPSGNSWATWNADFFTPAKKLLEASPWAFSRGNHETCARAGDGWFYYLDPRPMPTACNMYSDPYLITLGSFQLLMLDSSQANDAEVEAKQLALYTAELRPYAKTSTWLALHHPLFALKRDKEEGGDKPTTDVLRQAFELAGMQGVSLILAGHTHLFEVLSFSGDRPPQIVAGDAGTSLATKIEKDLSGQTVFGNTVRAGASRKEFGFTLLENRKGRWDLRLKDLAGQSLVSCTIRDKLVDCGK